MASLPTNQGARRVPETVQLRLSILGVMLKPVDSQHHPLLTELYGGAEEVGTPLTMDIEGAIHTVKDVAKDRGIGVSICGRHAMGATIRLWPPKRPVAVPLKDIFAGLGHDAAAWGVTDFYARHAAALRSALSSRDAFTTGWYGVKKEIQTARISRHRRGGRLHLEVSVEMDDPLDLADTALWTAAGGNDHASCGDDALRKLGLSEEEVEAELSALANMAGPTTASGEATLHPACGFARICSELDALCTAAEGDLEAEFDALVESARDALARLRSRRLGST